MASMTTPTMVQQSLVEVESSKKNGRLRSWKSVNRLFSSMKLNSEAQQPNTSSPRLSQVDNATTTDASIEKQLLGKELTGSSQQSSPFLLTATSSWSTTDDFSDIKDTSDLNTISETEILIQATAALNTKDPIPDNLPPLPLPILIPRLRFGRMSPLARAWAPEAERHAITKEAFVAFVDNLNILSSPPAVTAVLKIAAFGIGFAPIDGADGIAALTELAAVGLGHYTVVTRCRRFLDKTNEEYFHPRQLHVRLVNTKTMRKALNIAKTDPLVAPLAEETLDMTAHDRCMSHMRTYCCELSSDVPPPSPQTKILARFSAWHVTHKTRKFDRAAARARKRAWKRHLKGKKHKAEGKMERLRVKTLQWMLIQNLCDFEEEERVKAEMAEEKKRAKKAKKSSTWMTI